MDFVFGRIPGSAPAPPGCSGLIENFFRTAEIKGASELMIGSTGRRDRIRVPGSIVPESELVAVAAIGARDDELREIVQ